MLTASLALGVASIAGAEPSVSPTLAVHGGVFFWPAYSNRDEVEADTGPGFTWSASLGLRVASETGASRSAGRRPKALDRVGLGLELKVGQRFGDIHGINDGASQRTGDGKTLRATRVQLLAWPSWRFDEAVSLYAGGGGGGSHLSGLGSTKWVWSAQVGLGLLVDLPLDRPRMQLDLGWRSWLANSTKIRDALVDFDGHGGTIGLIVRF